MIVIQYLKKLGIVLAFLSAYFILIALNTAGFDVWLPSCPIKATTGIECFGCGLNHAAISLVQGDFQHAFEHNPLIFVVIPIILGFLIYDFTKYLTKNKNTYL